MNPPQVAIYARVSSEQQAEAQTIASQVAALRERLRDVVAAGSVDQLYVHAPDRLARKYAYQVLLVDEFRRAGVEVVFLNRAWGRAQKMTCSCRCKG